MAEGTASTHLGMSSLNPDRDAVPKNVSRDSLLGQESATGPDSTKQERREAPETLRRSAFHEWLSTIFDIFFAAIPLFFLVIAALCLRLDKQPTSQYGDNLKAITLLSPTIFPIIYAAILGKVLRRIALYKAERSSTIGTLEQLIGSQSFVSSIERQFVMRRINIAGLLIIIAWLLSPLGGQSSLRLLSIEPYQEVVNTTIKHHSVAGFANDTLFGPTMEEYFWGSYAPIYMTALQTGRQIGQGPRDLFDNVRIPDLRSLDLGEDPSQHTDRWYSVENRPELSYTSLHGQPVIDLPKSGNVSFSLESSYWETQCGSFNPAADWLAENSTDEDPYRGAMTPGPSTPTFALLKKQETTSDETASHDSAGQFQFNYVSKINQTRNINSSCTAWFRTVESEVFCEDAKCLVQKMRHLERNLTSMFRPIATDGEEKSNWNLFVFYLTETMPGADVGIKGNISRRSELVEQWIMNPNNMWSNTRNSHALFEYVDFSTLAPEVFSSRLQVAMNTYWDSTMNSSVRVGNLTSQDLHGTNETLIWTPINAVGARWAGQRYICNMVFAILTFVISGLLFIAAVVSVALGVMTRAPDVLGYVSTLARDDPYFGKHVPSYLDGLDASRMLRDERVILGDVNKNGNVGHVAFASMGMDPGRISRKRLYD